MHLLTLSFNPKTIPLQGYPKIIPYIKFEHFGGHSFELLLLLKMRRLKVALCENAAGALYIVMLRTNRQTNKQTVSNVIPTSTDIVSVGKKL